MKGALTFALAAVAVAATIALAAASGSEAGTSARDPRVPALQTQVRSLQAQVSALRGVVNHNADVADCRFVYQFRFNVGVLDIFSALIGAAPYSGGYPSDNGACARAGMTPPSFSLRTSSTKFGTLAGILARTSGA